MKILECVAVALFFALPACAGGNDRDGVSEASELTATSAAADSRIDPAMVGTFHDEPLGDTSIVPPTIQYRPNPLFRDPEIRELQLRRIQLHADGTFAATFVVWVQGARLLDVTGTWETKGDRQFTLTYSAHDQNQKKGTWHDTFVWTTTSDSNERYVGFLGDGWSPISGWALRDLVPSGNWFVITKSANASQTRNVAQPAPEAMAVSLRSGCRRQLRT